MLFIFIFSIGIGPLPWVIIGEIFPEECKSASASLSAVVNQLMAFITIKTVANIQVSLSALKSPIMLEVTLQTEDTKRSSYELEKLFM